MTATTIIRRDLLRPLTQIVGLDVSEDRAERLIRSSRQSIHHEPGGSSSASSKARRT
jgi:hypothetical protein